ncbi:putative signal-transduction protein containing cAMP-binding and CBS domains [Thioalkalivibrio nitratireducens DSM 14787]|uniref:Signal-transduction protein containing cAMP-binding and CBS domains n=1 Tax=Thioalkalivibrio nitratireducens (strain DSM 14787 / UNIQEM 213 / ALEN2) TaxID=1255043 RepID=L0E0J5_THIND|nr:putative nucleotidyltransferase substrate binding domain-containing protein [Thioalkalivibrio nitratireducens]AGA34735.1 putative signal-transduction protein containing cAMP-binding and CBS domains [Thioalkalivibrio nitratireducens DSM 14787]
MDAELREIRDFLAASPDYAVLPEPALDRLPRQLVVRYLRRGSPFPPVPADAGDLWLVRTGAIDLRTRQEELLDKLGEGDVFAVPGDDGAEVIGRVVEDALFYVLPAPEARELRRQHPEFADRFDLASRRPLQRALAAFQGSAGRGDSVLTVSVGELVTRAPEHIGPDATIQDGARHMSEQEVSALLVMADDELIGIVTDHDLRKRCLATGRSRQEPIGSIMSSRLQSVTPETPAFEALLLMSRLDIHHLPVLAGTQPVGLISTTDLIRHQGTNAVYLVRDIRRCESVAALRRVTQALPELQIHLVQSGATALHLGQAVTAVIDALTRRLLKLGVAELGTPPVPFAWLACGSQGRREQTVHTDQDNALIYADTRDAGTDGYFQRLAEFVTDGLDQCGIVYCPGEVSPRSPHWRRTVIGWRDEFARVLRSPDRKAAMLAAHYFDLRVVHGDALLFEPLRAEALRYAVTRRPFQAQLAENALDSPPPLGFFRQLVLIQGGDQADTLDVKKQGLLLVTALARVYALQAGVPGLHTLDRLRGAVETGVIGQDDGANLCGAYETLASLRAQHQTRQIKRGERPDNFIPPRTLSPLERGHLKDAFGVIATMQKNLRARLVGRGTP